MALIIRGLTMRVPTAISKPLLKLLVLLRLRDPAERVLNRTSNSTSLELDTLPPMEVETADNSTANLNVIRINSLNVDTLAANLRITIDLRTAPILGVLILLATKTIGVEALKLGIVGDSGVKPYNVLVLFISLVSFRRFHPILQF